MNDPIDKLHRAATRASGFLDLNLREKAIKELETLLFDDDYIDSLYDLDMKDEIKFIAKLFKNRKGN